MNSAGYEYDMNRLSCPLKVCKDARLDRVSVKRGKCLSVERLQITGGRKEREKEQL